MDILLVKECTVFNDTYECLILMMAIVACIMFYTIEYNYLNFLLGSL